MDTPNDTLRQRRRLAEEQLIGDGQWRGDLNDEQAQRLLDWGLGFMHEMVWQTAVLPDAQAEAILEEAATAVTRIMRRLNDLVADLPSWDQATAVAHLHIFLQDVAQMTGQPLDPEKVEQLVYSAESWDNETIFTRLCQLIAWEPDEEE